MGWLSVPLGTPSYDQPLGGSPKYSPEAGGGNTELGQIGDFADIGQTPNQADDKPEALKIIRLTSSGAFQKNF